MAARISRLTTLALLAMPPGLMAQAPEVRAGPLPESQVITGETLRRAGATRLSDILSLAHRWDVETVDGSAWSASPLGGDPFLPARWTVLVDGRRMDDDLFGVTALDRLAVPLEQIVRVELIELPRLVAGGLTTGGLVRITTADPPEGPSVGGRFVTGSEIGDPGPFAFTPEARSNVDRLGHKAYLGAGYATERWFADVALGWSTIVPTDPSIVRRYVAALGAMPRIRSTEPALRIGGRLAGGRHDAVLRHSRVDGALSLRPFGTEIATDERFTLAGVAGEIPLRAGRLRYDLSHTRNQARRAPSRPGPPLDWLTGTTEARLELARPGAALELAGLRLRRRAVGRPMGLANPALSLATAYAEARIGRVPAGVTAGGSITVGEGEVGLAALLRREWMVERHTTLEAVLNYERVARAEDNTTWAWSERGFTLLEESGPEFDVVGAPRSPERLGADLRLSSRLFPGLTLTTRGLFRRSRRLSQEHRELHFVFPTSSFEGPAVLVHGTRGELAGGSVELTSRPTQWLVARASYWIRRPVGGDSVFREAWAVVPRQGARVTTEYVPAPGLELWLAASFRGATHSREFTAVEMESGGQYRARVDDVFTLDVAIQKWLWDRRVRAHFGVRNLLGADLRYHPAGATFGPTVTLELEGALPRSADRSEPYGDPRAGE